MKDKVMVGTLCDNAEHTKHTQDDKRLKGLFITQCFPTNFKDKNGVFQRLNIFAQAISELCDELIVLFFAPSSFKTNASIFLELQDFLQATWSKNASLLIENLQAPEKKYFYSYYVKGIYNCSEQEEFSSLMGQKQINAVKSLLLTHRPDFIFLENIHLFFTLQKASIKIPPTFMDLDDIEHLALFRRLIYLPRWPRQRLRVLQIPALMLAERKAISICRKTFLCSELDQNYLSKLFFLKPEKTAIIQNSIEIPNFIMPLPAAYTCLFIGAFGYEPNVQAADFLIKKIWPLVQAVLPQAHLIIAGANPKKIPSFHENPEGVSFPGFVIDLKELYSKVTVACCPILTGAGTRIKIIEAAGYARPIVSTSIGAEGLEFADGEEIIIADDPEKFAMSCIRLLTDFELANHIGKSAYNKAATLYSCQSTIKKIKKEILESL